MQFVILRENEYRRREDFHTSFEEKKEGCKSKQMKNKLNDPKNKDKTRELHSDAKVNFEPVENNALNDYLLKKLFLSAHLQRIFAQQNEGRVLSLQKNMQINKNSAHQ